MTSILVVEDQKLIALGLEKRLKGLGYAVVGMVSSGEEAVQMAMKVRPDLVLMDIHLGAGIDGVEAAGLIRRQMNLPVVYLTAHSDDVTVQRAKLTEPFGYVLKPYEDKDLQTAIEIGLYKHQMEQRLSQNEQWLAAVLSSIGDGVIATDEQGRVRFMNALAERLTGWTQPDALERDVREVFHVVEETGRELLSNPALTALETGEPTTLGPATILIDRSGVERPIDHAASPLRSETGKVSGAVLAFRDISERHHLEDHLRQAQKMEALGRLAGGIAHDFNNIMTVINGYSELLLVDDQSPEEKRDAIRDIHAAGHRAAALTQQIMAFSSKQMLLPTVLNLNTILQDMGSLLKRTIGSNIKFNMETAPDLGLVKADRGQIEQVIMNLAANARDAMLQGGRLVLRTANCELGEVTSRQHPDVVPGHYAMLSVSDTGSGMSEDVLGHAFEPFFTTKRFGQGSGLGLATVYGIVKQSGGHVEVTSQVGEGTTVRVFLPHLPEQAPPPSVGSTPRREKGQETVLLVEDDSTVRQLAGTVLQRSGYCVLQAANGRAAVELAENHPEPIHLLVTDLMMPHLSGREVADRLTVLHPGLRVLFMSGYTEDVVVHQGVQSAADFLHKPFSPDEMRNKVREILDRG